MSNASVRETKPAGPAAAGMRVWLFRALILVGMAGVVYAWLHSWWNMDIARVGKNVVNIYPTGLRHTLTVTYYQLAKGAAAMPAWFTPFAWAFFAALLVGLILSMVLWLRNGKGRLLLGAVGLGQFMTPVIMAIVAMLKLKQIHMPLQGDAYYSAGGYYNSQVATRLLPAWYIALGVGVFILLLALLRDRIIGKPVPKSGTGA